MYQEMYVPDTGQKPEYVLTMVVEARPRGEVFARGMGGKYLAIARGVIIMPRRRVGCANDISGSRGQRRRRVLKTVMFGVMGARIAVSTRTMIIHCQKFRIVQQHSSSNNNRQW